jgi:hypothetical protein
MNNKISFIQNIKNYFIDISVYSKDKIHSFIRHKIKIGYRVPKDHEFVPDQSKLGMHLAILDPENFVVADIMTTDPQFGSFLQKRPIFVEINHEQRKKINLKEGKDWVFNPELKDFFELEHIEEGL